MAVRTSKRARKVLQSLLERGAMTLAFIIGFVLGTAALWRLLMLVTSEMARR